MCNKGSYVKHVLVFFAILLPFISNAQKYSVGLKAAPLINWSAFGDSEDKEQFSSGVRIGYSVGALISFPLKHEFDFFC